MASITIDGLPTDWYFPSTRYRGSKRKILPWIWSEVSRISFNDVLDLFGGSSVVSLMFKRMGKRVTTNDYLLFNHATAIALVQNNVTKLTNEDIDFICSNHREIRPDNFVSRTFRGYYFLDHENKWIDRALSNISALGRYYAGSMLLEKRNLAIWCLGQACLIKRPFNLFHRKNLYLRTNDAPRQFGNKTTWEAPFEVVFRRFASEANQSVFDNGQQNSAICCNAMKVEQRDYDLVYLDPPYFFSNQRDTDYREKYHFLEGLTVPDQWPAMIDYGTHNLRLLKDGQQWPHTSAEGLTDILSEIIGRFSDSTIVISHKSNSKVSVGTVKKLLEGCGKRVRMRWTRYTYALSKRNGKPRYNIEWLIVGA
jgi:adenine-specific DNA-methyltransferase